MGADIKSYWQNYINGAFADGGAGRIGVDNSATGEQVAEHALADAADIDSAVHAALRCHQSGPRHACRRNFR